MRHIDLELRGDHIALDALLKATGLAASGGEAKAGIAAGRVQVDGQVELRRGRKVRAGQVVAVPGVRVCVHAPPDAAAGEAQPPDVRRGGSGAGEEREAGMHRDAPAAPHATAPAASRAPDDVPSPGGGTPAP